MSREAAQATIVERPLVKISGAPLPDALEQSLIDARVELVRNGASQAILRFFDADFELLGKSLRIGSEIEVAFPRTGSSETVIVFNGEILELAAEQGPEDLHELVVTAFDWAYRLSGSVVPVTYTNMTYKAIVNKMCAKYGLRANLTGLDDITYPYVLQTTDDLTFLNEIAARCGASWRVVAKQLILGAGIAPTGGNPAPPTVTVGWGSELRRFTTRLNGAGPVEKVIVRGWDIPKKQALVGQAGAKTAGLSTAAATAAAQKDALTLVGKQKIISDRITDSTKEADMVAQAVRERLDSALTQARGEVIGNPALVPGAKLKVEGMGASFSGEYLLTSVEHVYTPSGYVTRFHAGSAAASTLVDLLGTSPRQFHGATIGIVTANNDPDGTARVKVKLPMLGDDVVSDWARVVTLGGGPKRGVQITPAVNDEVIVIFEAGDVRRPIVLGGVWNGTDKPPKETTQTTKDGKTKIWHVRTEAGHQLTFDESETGKENVLVLLKDGKTKLHLGVDKIELWAAGNKPIEIKSNLAKMLLDKDNVTIEGNNITLKATQAMKIEGMTVEATAKTSAKVNGATVEVKGSGTVNVEASGLASLKGSLVKIN